MLLLHLRRHKMVFSAVWAAFKYYGWCPIESFTDTVCMLFFGVLIYTIIKLSKNIWIRWIEDYFISRRRGLEPMQGITERKSEHGECCVWMLSQRWAENWKAEKRFCLLYLIHFFLPCLFSLVSPPVDVIIPHLLERCKSYFPWSQSVHCNIYENVNENLHRKTHGCMTTNYTEWKL